MWHKSLKLHRNKQFIAFVAIGMVAAAVNVLCRIVLSLALANTTAIVLAYLCGMTTAYLLSRRYVFAPSGRHAAGEYVRFGLVNLVALVQVIAVSIGLYRYVFPAIHFSWNAETIAHGIGVAIPVVTSYLGHKYFSFAANKPASDLRDIARSTSDVSE